MFPDSLNDWHAAVHAAAESIRAAPFADLDPARVGIALTRYAAVVAEPEDLDAAARWMAITETVIAVSDDLAFLPGGEALTIPLPDEPFPETPELWAALQVLWTAIYDGLQRYMLGANNAPMIACAAVTTRSLLRLIEAGSGARP
ncbi:hypothetical protein [Cryptosporangium aurantiacum]|uniref:Uncharacterized protein n=1 Tax=Cryptosporangium aurantiacum TaxID=134849 RepID=A0A1M7PQA7_9ACTN|nr:hypothetical protein [Cryptosporangium aurantiacum]SHN19391.1 hypothetical protein SAMN05443668_103570 [Cryptosporangium aurantiacum]